MGQDSLADESRMIAWLRSLFPKHESVAIDVPTIGKREFIKARPEENADSRLRRLHGQEMVLIKAEDFEAGWLRDISYIPEDLSRKTIGDHIGQFEKFLAENEVIEAANVIIKAGGHIAVMDGRHRARVLLNLGMESIPVTMTKESVEFFERYYP